MPQNKIQKSQKILKDATKHPTASSKSLKFPTHCKDDEDARRRRASTALMRQVGCLSAKSGETKTELVN